MADDPVLPERAVQLLADLPIPDRDWEEQARAIEARLTESERGSTEARWLEAPLPSDAVGSEVSTIVGAATAVTAEVSPLATSANGPSMSPTETPFPFDSMPAIVEASPSSPDAAPILAAAAEITPKVEPSGAPVAPERTSPTASASSTPLPSSGSSQSLSALARSVAQKSARPQSRDIARESLSVAAAARSKTDVVAERVRGPRATPPPPPSNRSAPPPPPAAQASNAQLGPWIALGGLGLAAAVALWILARPNAPSALTPSAETAAIAARPAAAPLPAPEAPLAAPTREEAAAPAPQPLAANDAPQLAASSLPLAAKAASPSVRTTGESALAAALPPTAPGAASAGRPAPEAIVLEDTPAPATVAGAKAAPQAAASGLRPAAGSQAGGLPDRPATGAVQAAIGSVMGPARACVAGGVATPAQVTFAADGTVQSVAISGPNAGTASASCIEGALRRARVAPFANPTFSLMVWVRP